MPIITSSIVTTSAVWMSLIHTKARKQYGINNNILNWLKDFLNNRYQTVIVEGKKSTPKPVLSGVPQGTVLGPLLFLVYINDMPNCLSKGTKIRLFADDSLVYRDINEKKTRKYSKKTLMSYKYGNIHGKWNFTLRSAKC